MIFLLSELIALMASVILWFRRSVIPSWTRRSHILVGNNPHDANYCRQYGERLTIDLVDMEAF